MAKILGYYKHERSENLHDFYVSIGIEYIDARIMSRTSPKLSIRVTNDVWNVFSLTYTGILSRFKLGVQFLDYLDEMTKCYRSTATLEGDTLKIVSILPNKTEIIRTYEPNGTGCILTLTHPESGTQGRRYFVANE